MINMYIEDDYGFEELKNNCWSGAVDTLNTIEENGKEEELIQLLEDIFPDFTPTLTEVNGVLCFDSDYIFKQLGIKKKKSKK